MFLVARYTYVPFFIKKDKKYRGRLGRGGCMAGMTRFGLGKLFIVEDYRHASTVISILDINILSN